MPRDQLTILHLSDVQFGPRHRFGRASSVGVAAQRRTLFQSLQRDVAILTRVAGLTPDVIALTSDLAESGKTDQFEEAGDFLQRLSHALKVPRSRVLVVPGNHDLDRDSCELYFSDCDSANRDPAAPYYPKYVNYERFFRRFYQSERYSFSEEAYWSLYPIDSLNLVVAGFNSTVAESHREGRFGYIGERQLDWFENELARYANAGWFRLGLVHHNAHFTSSSTEPSANDPSTQPDVLRDYGVFEDRLQASLNMLLHGHTHLRGIRWMTNRVPILSTGAASVEAVSRPPEIPNQYQVIRVTRDDVTLYARQYVPHLDRWVGDTSVTRDGTAWQLQAQVAFQRVEATFGRRPERSD
ncbi:MAG: metallophosphoesterase [Myxococcales bacterium]|nr:metallophosphoesterase [Myxococcales bacterium]